jgi:hypothetical protein
VFAKSGLIRDNRIPVTKLDPFEILIVITNLRLQAAAVEMTGVMWHWKCGQFAALASSFILTGESEYEEFPRGRVMYNTKTQRFTLLADRCILRDKDAVSRIMSELHLPGESTDKGTDAHYRCSACLRAGAGK